MPALSRVGTAFFLNKPGGGGGGGAAEPGEAIFHADQGNQANTWASTTVYNWTVPAGVTEISVVCVGGGGSGVADHDGASGCGGGLAFKNQIPVVPGSTIEVSVGGGGDSAGWGNWGKVGDSSQIVYNGTIYAKAGGGNANTSGLNNGLINNTGHGVPGGDFDGGGRGGRGQHWGGCRQSGGGAGGYSNDGDTSSNGGNAEGGECGNPGYAGNTATSGSNGAGGGGMSQNGSSPYYSNGGGGVGMYGRGANGAAGGNGFNDGITPTGKGGSYDSGTYDTSGIFPNVGYIHNTGLRGYSCEDPYTNWANPGSSPPTGTGSVGIDLGNNYRRDNGTQGQGHTRPDGGFPGGGGGGANSGRPCGYGGHGCVRIVWGKINNLPRRFPTQGVNKTDEYPGLSGATIDVNGRQMMY